MPRDIEQEDPKVLKDFKNTFAGTNNKRVLKRILFEAGMINAETTPEDLPLKNFGVWLLQMIGGNNVDMAVDRMINAMHETPLIGEK